MEPVKRMAADLPVFCDRCGCELHPGSGNFYVVKIEAFADPSPPDLTEAFQRGSNAEMDRLVDELGGLSEQEAMDQVYRRLTLHLCTACYGQWIENPAG